MTEVLATRRLSPEAAELLKAGIDSQVEKAITKSYGTSQLAQLWASGMDMPESRRRTATKPYSQVELVFACVNKLIANVMALPLVLSTIDEKIIESGEVWDVLFNNPLMSFETFIRETVGHYALSRDVFWVFTDMVGRRPKEIFVVSGTQMHPITHNRRPDGDLIGWEFTGAGGRRAEYTPDEVWQLRNFNPYDRFHGSGPLSAAKQNIDYDYIASMFETSSLQNGAEPGIILTHTGSMDKEQKDAFVGNFDARHGGPDKARRTVLLTGGVTASTLTMDMVNMDVANLTDKAAKKICSAFATPPAVVGLVTEAQYAHGPAQQDYIFNTVIPLASLIAGELTYGVISRFYSSSQRAVEAAKARYFTSRLPLLRNRSFISARHKAVGRKQKLFAWFDSSQHPTVQASQQETAEKVLKYTESGVPLNDLIEAHDLPYQKQPWGDDFWINMGRVPARYTLDAGMEGLTGGALPEGEPAELAGDFDGGEKDVTGEKKIDDPRKLRIWNNWQISWAGLEREYKEAMRKFFLRQQRELLAKLKKSLADAKSVKADPDAVIAHVVFDLIKEDGKLKVINDTFFTRSAELGIRQALSEVAGVTGAAAADAVARLKLSPSVRNSLTRSSHKIKGANRTTQRQVASQLRKGLEADEGLPQLTTRIRRTLGSNLSRAQRIARTQVAGAVGAGRHAGLADCGVKLKTWLTSGDAEVRQSHQTAGEAYAEGIPLNQAFIVGGAALMHPADPAGPAAEIINCRCVELARVAGSRSFSLDYYSNLKFYSLYDMENSHGQANK